MLKLAVVGAQTLLGRELVEVLETRDCSVLPLATGPLGRQEEEGDQVVFAPEASLLESLDLVILVDVPQDPGLLEAFPGRILDLRVEGEGEDFVPLAGPWPAGRRRLRARPALEQVLMLLPGLVEGLGEICGTYLRSVAFMGDRGLEGLHAQTHAILEGEEPEIQGLGYRAAFEALPQVPRGSLMEVWVPVFHGDLLILHLRAQEGQRLSRKEAPQGILWQERPPSSREVAVTPELLAHFAPQEDGARGVLTLGFDPILWGVLRPALRLLEL